MVISKNWAPKRGDLIWLDFDPQSGHEQAGRRPALVLSPISYNRNIGLALVCPVTSRIKGFPFEVKIAPHLKVNGVALADHIRSLDWKARKAEFACYAGEEVVREVLAKILSLLGDRE